MQLVHAANAYGAPAPIHAKEQLFANLCHEIRNPVHAIVGLSRVMASKQCSPERQTEYVQMLQQSASMLEELLNDVLDFSRIDAGMMELDAVPFDLARLVSETMQMIAPRAREKGLSLHMHCPELAPLVGDPLRLRQILLNLLGNAVKFTESGFVSLYTHAESDKSGSYRIRITITDTGIGIPAEKQATLFNEFRQADARIHSQYGGSGLGLAICQRLLSLMDGTISVASAPDAGSQFTVLLTLPAARMVA